MKYIVALHFMAILSESFATQCSVQSLPLSRPGSNVELFIVKCVWKVQIIEGCEAG